MSAHVLLNLLNELRKSDVLLNLLNKLRKRDVLLNSLNKFRDKFNKFSNTGAQMLDSIYHMTLKLLKIIFLT